MSILLKCLADGVGSGSIATIYTGLAGTKAVIHSMQVTNVTAGVLPLTVKLNPRTSGTDRTLIHPRNLAIGETYSCPEVVNQIIEAGGLLRLLGNGLEYVVSGAEIVEHA